MRVKQVVDEWFQDYLKPSMFICTISCRGKCCIEAGIPLSVCQNDGWRISAAVELSNDDLCKRYLSNPITNSIILGGLEPFEQFDEVYGLIKKLRVDYHCSDDVVIYTGYNKDEIEEEVSLLSELKNIVIKFGRYVPNKPHRFDDVLGVELASDNQYAERITK